MTQSSSVRSTVTFISPTPELSEHDDGVDAGRGSGARSPSDPYSNRPPCMTETRASMTQKSRSSMEKSVSTIETIRLASARRGRGVVNPQEEASPGTDARQRPRYDFAIVRHLYSRPRFA